MPRTAVVLLLALIASPAAAQLHVIADSALGPSLLVAALSLPSPAPYATTDSVFRKRLTRIETQYSRTSTTGIPSMLILGVRSDNVTRDSTGWNNSVFGVRGGLIRKGASDRDITVSALEVYIGGRDLAHMEGRRRPSIGLELVGGLSRLETNAHGSFALRFPVEFVRSSSSGATTLSIVPAMAWGHIRFRSCDDYGPGDNCGDLGVQLAMGRTRFVVGTSLTMALRSRMSVSVGAQQLFANTQQPRFVLALGWGG